MSKTDRILNKNLDISERLAKGDFQTAILSLTSEVTTNTIIIDTLIDELHKQGHINKAEFAQRIMVLARNHASELTARLNALAEERIWDDAMEAAFSEELPIV